MGQSTQDPPAGTETRLSSTVAATTDTTTVDETVLSTTTTSAKATGDSTKQASTTATNSLTKPTNTFVTLTTKVDAKGTTRKVLVDWTEAPKATCLWEKNIGHGQLDEDKMLAKVEEFCNRSQVDNRMKFDDGSVTYSVVDESDVRYDFEICPANRCPDYGQNMKDPLGDGTLTCSIIFLDLIWRPCKFCMLSKSPSS